MARDFSKASDKATAAADKAVGGKLDEITQQAADMEKVFNQLKLTDKATYDMLVEIVQKATKNHDSLAKVVQRVQDLGSAGVKLAARLPGPAGGGLRVVRAALGL